MQMETSSFIQTARKTFEFLVTDFGAVSSESSEPGSQDQVRYDWDFLYFIILKGRGEMDADFQVKDRSFRYFYLMFDLYEICHYLNYLDNAGRPRQTHRTSPLTRAYRQAQTEEERDEINLRMMKDAVLKRCIPIIEGDLTILELVGIDRMERK